MRAHEVIEMVEATFHETFKTNTMTKIDGQLIHTLVVCTDTHAILYTIDIACGYRYTTIDLDMRETDDCSRVSAIGTSDSMTTTCSEFLDQIESILTGNRFKFTTYTTRGK